MAPPIGQRLLPPLDDASWPEECAKLKDGFAGRLNIYRVMAHAPDLLNAWQPFRDHIVLESALTSRQKELVILRVGFRWRAAYEWAHHVARGRAAGLAEVEIRAAAEPLPDAPGEGEAALLFRAVDDLYASGAIGPETLEHLVDRVGVKAVVEVIATAGMYVLLAFLAKTSMVDLEADMAATAPDW